MNKLRLTILSFALAALGAACAQNATDANRSANQNGANQVVANQANINNGNMNHSTMNHAGMDHSAMNHSEMKSSPNAASAPYDLQFIDTMIGHHQGAVDMAKMVESRTERAELRAFANKVIADQNKEIERMKQWREQWYAGKSAAINMEMRGMADSMKMDMSRLTAAKDKQFDVLFVEMMIPHHDGAVTMSEDLLARGEHAELKTLANSIIKEQKAEIAQMQIWKSEWAR